MSTETRHEFEDLDELAPEETPTEAEAAEHLAALCKFVRDREECLAGASVRAGVEDPTLVYTIAPPHQAPETIAEALTVLELARQGRLC